MNFVTVTIQLFIDENNAYLIGYTKKPPPLCSGGGGYLTELFFTVANAGIGIELELFVYIKFGIVVERGELGNRNFVSRHSKKAFVGLFFLVFAALYSSGQRDPVADGEIADETGVSAPGDCGNVIGLVIRTVYRNQQVGNFSVERRGAVYGRLANVARKHYRVGVFALLFVEKLSYEYREHKA